MNAVFKLKNYRTASAFARRLLELGPNEEVATQARKVAKFAETNSENASEMDYNERNPFSICGYSFKPIYKGSPSVACAFCHALYKPEHAHRLCNVCGIAQIAADASGPTFLFVNRR